MEEARNLAQTIARILYDKKALNITVLDVSNDGHYRRDGDCLRLQNARRQQACPPAATPCR